MILDLHGLEDGAALHADLCIIGGGPAGISLALQFADTATSVLLVESGGLELERDTQLLAGGENLGLPYWDLEVARLRFLGGSSNHWHNWCGELDEADMLPRPWVPDSGWPITRAELTPYYAAARPLVGLGPARSDDWVWQRMGLSPLPLDPDHLTVRFWHKHDGRTAFGVAYRARLGAARNLRVLLHANATELHADPSGNLVERVSVRSLGGKAAEIRARSFVIACGGIDSARLLLLSDSVEPAGIGNRHDLVGRYFMEHPDPLAARVATADPLRLLTYLRHVNLLGRQGHAAGICLSPAAQRREGLLNGSLRLEFTAAAGDASESLRLLRQHWRSQGIGLEMVDDLWRVVRDVDISAYNLYRRSLHGLSLVPRPENVMALELLAQVEQSPNPDSRVMLTRERDALGLRRVGLDWRIADIDKRTLRRLTEKTGAEMVRLGLGILRIEPWLLDEGLDWGGIPNGGFHHMGTTRMSDDPRKGVVNRDLRVHGVMNLYVASSSVFPSAGYINPTLTIVALALRLADHLKGLAPAARAF
ncbi:GMC oxidoreductase [Arenibaculum pallidiluteum]|uniref:GMC oxidoreductase n=1 Tax=Arenibaculum pallidiluteum TaxID=2812559 RepID=UPI001A96525E|nr:GMC family oxidoreductase [Arenibaculum pallidiluteum]